MLNIKIGARLREERDKLEIGQDELAKIGGVSKTTQSYYETGKRNPDTFYLNRIAAVGFDIQYIITGSRGAVTVNIPFPEIEGLEEVTVEDMERTLELVKVHYMGMIKIMKKIRSVKAD